MNDELYVIRLTIVNALTIKKNILVFKSLLPSKANVIQNVHAGKDDTGNQRTVRLGANPFN